MVETHLTVVMVEYSTTTLWYMNEIVKFEVLIGDYEVF
jgi:hypothetical protein